MTALGLIKTFGNQRVVREVHEGGQRWALGPYEHHTGLTLTLPCSPTPIHPSIVKLLPLRSKPSLTSSAQAGAVSLLGAMVPS